MIPSPATLYERERIFNKEGPASPPRFGVCFSGGGNRSAAFAIGVLRALHEVGLLGKVDVISAVSGGSYALSWLLLQPYYHRARLENPGGTLGRIQEEMFNLDGLFQRYLVENAKPLEASSRLELTLQAALILPFDLLAFNALRVLSLPLSSGSRAARVVNLLNTSSLARDSYRKGIQRTYQVFPDPNQKSPVEKLAFGERVFIAAEHVELTRQDVPGVSFPSMRDAAQRAGLPSFVFNTTVRPPRPGANVPLGQRVFELGPIGFGSDSCGYLPWEATEGFGWEPGERVAKGWMFAGGASPYAALRNFNVAPAISGAALSGTNIEHRKLRWLLRMLNMGLEYVAPSPADPRRLVRLSDGGHSENLGAYALLRRRCRTILVVDAEYDPTYSFGAYRILARAAKQELGIEINISAIDEILGGNTRFAADTPILEGTTTSEDRSPGRIYYLKLSPQADLLGDQAQVINPYAEKHPQFPQEPTSDQYFQPEQFKAYRALGYAIARRLPHDVA
jgi:hypothetical protein